MHCWFWAERVQTGMWQSIRTPSFSAAKATASRSAETDFGGKKQVLCFGLQLLDCLVVYF